MTDEGWESRANCLGVDPSLFFPERGQPTKQAKQVCSMCEVKDPCLDAALARDERVGIWGGMSENERRKVRKERAAKKK